jgi:hypothetical protein
MTKSTKIEVRLNPDQKDKNRRGAEESTPRALRRSISSKARSYIKRLLVGILSSETAIVEHNLSTFDIISETPPTYAKAVLSVPERDVFELLDLISASPIVRIAAKRSKSLLLNPGEFLMLFLE